MYSKLDVITVSKELAISYALEDRKKYIKFFEVIERFIKENDLIIGEYRLEELSQEFFQYTVYGSNLFGLAKQLANKLYELDPEGLGHYTNVATQIPNELISIVVDTRELVTFILLPRYRGIQTKDLVVPATCKAFFSDIELNCMSIELQLINIYKDLSNPSMADEWLNLIGREQKYMIKHGASEANTASEVKDAEAKDAEAKDAEAKATNAEANTDAEEKVAEANTVDVKAFFTNKDEDLKDEDEDFEKFEGSAEPNKFIDTLLKKFVTTTDRILVGQYAIDKLTKKNPPTPHKLNLISLNELESEGITLSELGKTHGYNIQWSIDNPMIPTDKRLRRLTAYIITKDGKRPVVYIYNLASYEVVPYISETQTASIYTLMRMQLIELWTIKVLQQIKVVEENYSKNIQGQIKKQLTELRKDFPVEYRFPLTYMGRYEDPKIAQKRAIQEERDASKRFTPPYFPAQSRTHE